MEILQKSEICKIIESVNNKIKSNKNNNKNEITNLKNKIDNINTENKVAASSFNSGFQFKTAESFLNSLNNKKVNAEADISKYKEGQRIYHKKFGEGIINKIEEEGEDYKLDISFDKAGHKRLMAKFANLEII